MTRIVFIFLFLIYCPFLFGQTYHVPPKINFAGIELTLDQNLQKELQAEVDALTRSQTYLHIKLDRAKLYFPIIERIFREENVPDDFKYLSIQESALIPDAVSTSNAIGFWQFKKEAATEVGLRLHDGVDERLNIVSSTRGAARYLKINNAFFDNWLYALLAYNTGRGGAEKFVDKKYFGVKKMHVDKRLHWYVKKFLAHKIAYEAALASYPNPGFYLYEYNFTSNKSIGEIARDFSVDEKEVYSYNKWLKLERAPMDKEYTMIIPLKGVASQPALARGPGNEKTPTRRRHEIETDESSKYPEIEAFEGFDAYEIKINGKRGVLARNEQDNVGSLALIGNIDPEKFRKYNDLENGRRVNKGEAYYLQPKRNKAKVHYHVLQTGEDLWMVSQKFGVKLNKLMQKNRIEDGEEIKPGRVLWLRFIRPHSFPIEYRPVEAVAMQKPFSQKETEAVTFRTEDLSPHNSGPEPSETEMLGIPLEVPAEQIATRQTNEVVNTTTEPSTPHAEAVEDTAAEKTTTKEVALSPPVDTPDSPLPENAGEIIHVVNQGETLYAISRNYDVTISQIQLLNSLEDGADIKIGQELVIRKADSNRKLDSLTQNNSKSYIYHKVATGETLYQIARRYQVTIQQLLEWNQKTDFNIQIGEDLRVSN